MIFIRCVWRPRNYSFPLAQVGFVNRVKWLDYPPVGVRYGVITGQCFQYDFVLLHDPRHTCIRRIAPTILKNPEVWHIMYKGDDYVYFMLSPVSGSITRPVCAACCEAVICDIYHIYSASVQDFEKRNFSEWLWLHSWSLRPLQMSYSSMRDQHWWE